MARKIVDIDPDKPLDDALKELGLQPRPLLVLLGDFAAALNEPIRAICSRVIAPIALDPGAVILDDAKSSGCAFLMGQSAVEQDSMPTVVGVVGNKVPDTDIDSNHELVLRLPAAWSDHPKYMFQLADKLAAKGADGASALALLFGGGAAEKKALIRCARRDWPVLVFRGTGGLADELANATVPAADGKPPAPPTDPALKEIIETAALYISPLDSSMDDFKRILLGRIESRSDSTAATLAEAWHRFDRLDQAANSKQSLFRWVELSLIVLAVIAAFFAILSSADTVAESIRKSATLHHLVIVTPILISIVGAYNSHFRDGSKWVLLRGAAEALKREIFRFRTRAGAYSDEQCLVTSRESKLAAKITEITSALGQSDVNRTSLAVSQKPDPKRDRFLDPEEYLIERIQDQVSYFTKKTAALSRQLTSMQVLIYLAGGAGTFLAAVRLDVWVALTAATVTALTTKLQADQVENSLVQYNQALISLRNVEAWWKARSPWEKRRRTNIDLLVEQTERTLESETAGWVHQMQSALDKLTEKEPSGKPS